MYVNFNLVILFVLFTTWACVITALFAPNVLVKALAALLLAVPGAGVGWLVCVGQLPVEVASEDFYDIQTVTFPDGSRQQLYAVNGTLHSVQTEFHVIAPEGTRVKFVQYQWCYYGLSYWVTPRSFLVGPKEGAEKPI